MIDVFILYFSIFSSAVYAGSPASGLGTTFQNWNCCKPSCAWPCKASFSTPVKSCDINNQLLADANTGSSCQDGTSYMCADQVPWIVSLDMAHGFAAVTIEKGTEESWCCACYNLTFTSGPAKGKRMIVQAIDTNFGATTPDSKFVLALRFPLEKMDCANVSTSGGSTNSCVAQYGPGRWDSGLSTTSTCDNLPPPLQQACDWRSPWFGNDNPTVNFTQIKCPIALTNKTGCIRADEQDLFKSTTDNLSKSTKIAIGVSVPLGVAMGALLLIYIFIKVRKKRNKPTPPPPAKSTIPINPNTSATGIKKFYQQNHLGLNSRPVVHTKERYSLLSPRHNNGFLYSLEPIPSPTLGMRRSLVMEKVELELDLEGSLTGEMEGDMMVREGGIGMVL